MTGDGLGYYRQLFWKTDSKASIQWLARSCTNCPLALKCERGLSTCATHFSCKSQAWQIDEDSLAGCLCSLTCGSRLWSWFENCRERRWFPNHDRQLCTRWNRHWTQKNIKNDELWINPSQSRHIQCIFSKLASRWPRMIDISLRLVRRVLACQKPRSNGH